MKTLTVTITPEVGAKLVAEGKLRAMGEGFSSGPCDSLLVGILRRLTENCETEWTPRVRKETK